MTATARGRDPDAARRDGLVWALKQTGLSYSTIAKAFGISTTRAQQMVERAERDIANAIYSLNIRKPGEPSWQTRLREARVLPARRRDD